MGKKEWMIYIVLTISMFAFVAVLLLVSIPQIESVSELPESYKGIVKSEYTFDESVNDNTLVKEYDITSKDVSNGLKKDKYEQGNINPFTPNADVTIYNEPTKQPVDPNKPLTPSDK